LTEFKGVDMIDLKKLSEFQTTIEKVSLEICEHVKKDLKPNLESDCSAECPYHRLCEILTIAKYQTVIMLHNHENPNKTRLS
jgi:hypothetical protein